MLSITFDDWGGSGLTLTFPLTSAGPGPTSAALKFYIFSAEIAIPLRLMLIPVFHNGALDAETSALDAETSAIPGSYRQYRRGAYANCRVGITPQIQSY